MSRVLPIFSTNLAVDFLARLLLLPPLPPLVLPVAEAAAEATEGTGTNSCKRRENCITASLERGHPATEVTARRLSITGKQRTRWRTWTIENDTILSFHSAAKVYLNIS